MDGGELQVERTTGKTKKLDFFFYFVCHLQLLFVLFAWCVPSISYVREAVNYGWVAMTESDRGNRCGRRGIRK